MAPTFSTVDVRTGETIRVNGTEPEPPAEDIDNEAARLKTADEIAAEEFEDETAPHPFPDDAPMPGAELGWLHDATLLYTTLNDSPPELNLLTMLTTAAAALQAQGELQMGYEDIHCNLFGLGIAPSGSRKSTSAGKGRRLLTKAERPDYLFTGSATSEGLVRRLKQYPSTLYLVNEGATLLASHRKRYLQDVKTELCNVFDGLPMSRNLANETITADNPRLTILAVTTPQGFADSVEAGDWHTGFLARFIYVVPTVTTLPPVRGRLMTEAQKAEETRITGVFRSFAELPFKPFLAEDDAMAAWADWSNRIRTAAYAYEHEAVQALAERAPTMALKMAMVLSACRGDWGRIDAPTMAAALSLATFFLSHARKAMHTWDTAGADMSTMQKVLGHIYRTPNATTGPMRRALNLPKHKLDACLRELAARGAVTTEEYEYQAGKVTTRYTAVVGRLNVK